MQTRLLTDPIGPTLAKLAAPNIVAMFIMLATSMAEAFYIGQLGIAPLAGLALAFPMIMLTMMMAGGSFGGAIAGAVAQQLGANNKKAAESVALHSFLLTIGFSMIFSWLFLRFGSPLYSALGGRDAVLTEALIYSDMFFTGCIAIWVANGLNAIIRGTGQMTVAAGAMALGSCIQIVVSALLVFGIGPFPAMGVAGAALGNIVGFTVAGLIQLWYLVRLSPTLRLGFQGNPIKFAAFLDILKVGSMASVSPLSSVITVIIITAMMARLGVDVLAGYGIGARLEFLMIPLIFGIGSASITMVGAHFGAGKYQRGVKIGWISSLTAAGLAGLLGVVLALFPSLWANLFTEVEAVREACRRYLQIVGPFYAFFGLGLCLYFASQGARRLFWPVMGAFSRLIVVAIGGWYLSIQPDTSADDFFVLISIAMATYGLVTAATVYLGAWTRGLD
ncbi:MAG: MATE family efflux transporter [Porticoccaceae bacterium]|nr:MATE family efflux transporter [Porticoccaceae bacterium]MDG1474433.1 MATE family efflux transporter [Porticoccaceae bacterium]